MEITITMLEGTSLKLMVQPDLTVGSLKTLIQDRLGFPPQSQRLILVNGHRTPLNQDSGTLGSYGLFPGCRVSLLLLGQPAVVQVFLRNEKGKVSTYDVRPDLSVQDFKLKVQGREGVPQDQQRLIHQGREMAGGALQDYGVVALSTIDLALKLRGG